MENNLTQDSPIPYARFWVGRTVGSLSFSYWTHPKTSSLLISPPRAPTALFPSFSPPPVPSLPRAYHNIYPRDRARRGSAGKKENTWGTKDTNGFSPRGRGKGNERRRNTVDLVQFDKNRHLSSPPHPGPPGGYSRGSKGVGSFIASPCNEIASLGR